MRDSLPIDPLSIGPFWVAAIVVVAILLVLLGATLSRWVASQRSRDRNATAQYGEREAERLLAKAGFRTVARQVSRGWRLAIDGHVINVGVRADLIVERYGRQFVAEVKTGEHAPDPRLPATRRQLLEYSLVFGAMEVLLVDVPAREIHVVSFPDVEVEDDDSRAFSRG